MKVANSTSNALTTLLKVGSSRVIHHEPVFEMRDMRSADNQGYWNLTSYVGRWSVVISSFSEVWVVFWLLLFILLLSLTFLRNFTHRRNKNSSAIPICCDILSTTLEGSSWVGSILELSMAGVCYSSQREKHNTTSESGRFLRAEKRGGLCVFILAAIGKGVCCWSG